MNKQDIVNYVLETPYNTNKMVLESMLESLDGGGSGDNETLLWENSSKSTSRSSFDTDVPLETISSYTKLKIIYHQVYTNETVESVWNVDDFLNKKLDGMACNLFYITLCERIASTNTTYIRRAYINANTKTLWFSTAEKVGASSSPSTSDYSLPYYIYGIK